MTLPSSGAISMQAIATELKRTLPISLNDNGVLTLAGKSALPVTMPGDFYGKKSGVTFNGLATGSGTSVSDVPFGAIGPSRRIVVAIHFRCSDTTAQLNVTSATIGGVAASVHVQRQARFLGSGGAEPAVLVAIASAIVPSGTSGTVSIGISGNAGSSNISIGSFRAIGLLNSPSTAHNSSEGGTSTSVTLNIASGGTAIVAATVNGTSSTLNVSGLNGGADAYDNSQNGTLAAGAQFGADLAANPSDQVDATQSQSNNGMVICGLAWVPG
jgi:hypothetical protein